MDRQFYMRKERGNYFSSLVKKIVLQERDFSSLLFFNWANLLFCRMLAV